MRKQRQGLFAGGVRPDMPDQKFWRIDPRADYGPLNPLARGRIDLGKVSRHWDDMARLAGSLRTG